MAVADEVTQQYAAAMEEAIASASKAEAETNRLKRKYEPDEPEVLMDKILQMCDDNSMFYMRVQILTGAKMTLTLIRPTRNNGNVPDYTFRPHLTTHCDTQEYFERFGMWQVYVGDGGDEHNLLVTFDHKGVRIRPIRIPSEDLTYSGDLRISALSLEDAPEFALTHADDA